MNLFDPAQFVTGLVLAVLGAFGSSCTWLVRLLYRQNKKLRHDLNIAFNKIRDLEDEVYDEGYEFRRRVYVEHDRTLASEQSAERSRKP